jgi:hypothetical protein
MMLTRSHYGDYVHKFSTALCNEAHGFFRSHDATREAMSWMHVQLELPQKLGQEPDERVQFEYMQTRGGTFKIPEPYYTVERKTDNYGRELPKPRKVRIYRDSLNVNEMKKYKDDDIEIEAGALESGSYLKPCSYKF